MNDSENNAIESLKSELSEFEANYVRELPFNLFDRPSNKTTQLLASHNQNTAIDGRNRWFDYSFRDPCLVSRVLVKTSGYTDYHEFEFMWRDELGKDQRVHGKLTEGNFEFVVNDLCSKISFKPPSTWFSNPQILSVSIEGVERENISAALEALSDIQSIKDDILGITNKAVANANAKIQESITAGAERAASARELANIKNQQNRVKKEISELSNTRDELIAKNTAAELSFESTSQNMKRGNQEISRLSDHLNKLQSDIMKSDSQLKDLRANINLFPSEIVGFVDQGSNNIKQYIGISAIPIIIIGVMFVLLVKGAADLTVVVSENPKVNIQTLMISRTPYVAIAATIITACYKIARVFISEIMKINQQRLSLTKISIIAKDVSSSAEYNLELSDEDIYRLRADLKMQLLKDHLKDYLSKDFTLELPRKIFGLIPLGREKVSAKIESTGTESQ